MALYAPVSNVFQVWPSSVEVSDPDVPVAIQLRSRRAIAARDEPDFALAQHPEARVAGCERSFVGQRGRSLSMLPVPAAVVGGEDFGVAVERVAKYDAVRGVPKRDRVEEALWIGIG